MRRIACLTILALAAGPAWAQTPLPPSREAGFIDALTQFAA